MNHNWKIYDLKYVIADGMVTKATYACESSEGNVSTRHIGDMHLTTGSASDSDFINYENLTEGDVLSWVTGSIDTAAIETENSASIAQNIVRQAAVTEKTGTPWE